MIVFDLLCGAGHRFEGWFGSRKTSEPKDRKPSRCPVCGVADASVRRHAAEWVRSSPRPSGRTAVQMEAGHVAMRKCFLGMRISCARSGTSVAVPRGPLKPYLGSSCGGSGVARNRSTMVAWRGIAVARFPVPGSGLELA